MNRIENIENFFREYKELCEKYNVSLAHEDCHGGFLIDEYDEDNIEWVLAASDVVEDRKREDARQLEWFNRYMLHKERLARNIGKGNKLEIETESTLTEHATYRVVDENGKFVRYADDDENKLMFSIKLYEAWHGVRG